MIEEKVAILDAGAQYGKVIDRRIRELNVDTDLLPLDTPSEKLRQYKGIVVTGGPQSVYGEGAPPYNSEMFDLGIPVLGLCYGTHLMNFLAGGPVDRKPLRNDGQFEIDVDTSSKLFEGLDRRQTCLFTHGDSFSVGEVAEGYKATAQIDGLVAAIENEEKKVYGVQFHPEVDLTPNGKKMFHNFLYNICGFSGSFTMEDRIEKAIRYIQEKVGDKKALVLVSGGVDSTVCAALLTKALGPDRVYALHVDNGFMRKDESKKVKEALAELDLNLRVVNASEIFYNATTTIREEDGTPLYQTGSLNTVTEPEEKRVVIGDTFMRVAETSLQAWGLDWGDVYLAQGTLRPDLIESASKIASRKAAKIKSHHNDTPLVRYFRELGRIIEPLQDYHKDEVRVLGRQLGLPEDIVERQPFPGPGLAIRTICAEKPHIPRITEFEDTNEMLHHVTHYRDAPARFREEFRGKFMGSGPDAEQRIAELEERLRSIEGISGTLVPIRTVGVQGDDRTHSYLAALSGKKNWNDLFFLARLIPRIGHNINRLAYAYGPEIKCPVTEITKTLLTPDVIAQLQEADDIVNQELARYNLLRRLSQVPVISVPVGFDEPGYRSIAIRTFLTKDFMTGRPAVPGEDMPEEALDAMVSRILAEVPEISRVMFDLTSKPPGTTEWE